jgi:hypothetical protein
VVELSRVGIDARFLLWIVNEDGGWVKSRSGPQQGPQRLTPGSQSLVQHVCVPVAEG